MAKKAKETSTELAALRAERRQTRQMTKDLASELNKTGELVARGKKQVARIIADVVGETGQKILRAIVAGERDAQVLGAMKNVRVRASVDEIASRCRKASSGLRCG